MATRIGRVLLLTCVSTSLLFLTGTAQTPDGIPPDVSAVIVAGTGPGAGQLRALRPNGVAVLTTDPFGSSFTGGVRVAAGDVNGDGVTDLIAGAATAGGLVRVFSGANAQLLLDLAPFGPGFAGGLHVAAGDFDGDGRADILVGADTGGLASLIDGATGGVVAAGAPFPAAYTGGVTVALGDITGDGHGDLIFGTTVGGFVRVYNGATLTELASGFP